MPPYSRNLPPSEVVDSAVRHWEARRQAAASQRTLPHKPHALSIAIARETGTLGTLVADEVGKRLGWQVYDHELLERIAQEMGVRASLLESVDERQQGWLMESASAFFSPHFGGHASGAVSEAAYVRHLVETVLALGAHGECVIVGRGAAYILPSETTLRVRLVAPAKHRIATLRDRLNISATDAARRIRTTDRERCKFVKDHFFRDATDPRNYDLILNTSRWSIEAGAAVVIGALHELQAAREREEAAHPAGR